MATPSCTLAWRCSAWASAGPSTSASRSWRTLRSLRRARGPAPQAAPCCRWAACCARAPARPWSLLDTPHSRCTSTTAR
eukprot:9469126-Pyramimonas_sp.AAC.1